MAVVRLSMAGAVFFSLAAAALLRKGTVESDPAHCVAADFSDCHQEADCAALCNPIKIEVSKILPNVLIVGDLVSQVDGGYYGWLVKYLEGLAFVHHVGMFDTTDANKVPRGVCGSSIGAKHCIGAWVGNNQWDVISFNWGLNDICPSTYTDVSRKLYVDNVMQMFKELSTHLTPNGAIMWQTTTPVSHTHPYRDNTIIQEINKEILYAWEYETHPSLMNDLYTDFVKGCHMNKSTECYPHHCDCAQMQDPGNAMFNEEGNKYVGMLVADSIKKALFEGTSKIP